jgi:hypothetical protein
MKTSCGPKTSQINYSRKSQRVKYLNFQRAHILNLNINVTIKLPPYAGWYIYEIGGYGLAALQVGIEGGRLACRAQVEGISV